MGGVAGAIVCAALFLAGLAAKERDNRFCVSCHLHDEKFGRLTAYHMWSSKALGIVMLTAMTTVFLTGRPSVLVAITLWLAIANELEGFAASAILPRWRADVPTLLCAWRARLDAAAPSTFQLRHSTTDGASAGCKKR